MAANSGGAMDWNACIKPILSASHGSFNKSDIPDLVKAISRSKQDILKHETQYDSFYSSFAALSAHYLSTSAAYVSKNQLIVVSQACKVLLEFFLQKLQHFNEQSLLSQKDLMLLIKGLCKGVGFLQRSDVITLTGMLKSAKLPQISDAESTAGKPSEESRDVKRTRQDPASAILEQLTSPLHDIAERRKTADGSSETVDRDIDTSISHTTNSNFNTKNLFAAKNVTNLQQLNAGDILVKMCLDLAYLRRYVIRCTDALNNKGFVLPVTVSDATSVRSSFQMLLNDINNVWRTLSLPILEPLNDDRLASLTTVVTSCMYAAITVAMANSILIMSGGGSSKMSMSKDEDLDNCAVGIVEKSMEIFNYVSLAIRNSTRAGGHNLQNLQMTVAWTLLMGLQHILYMAPTQVAGTDKSKDGASKSQPSAMPSAKSSKESASSSAVSSSSGRQSLIKVQQGFGVLSVGLATQTLHLLISLLEDLQVEGALLPPDIDIKNIDGSSISFNVQGRYTAWQRIQKLLSHFNLSNLMFNLAAITYRKACMLKRTQKHPPDGETFSASDSSSCGPDEISWSDESSPDDEDSEPILGQWFEETVSLKEPASATITQSNQSLPDSTTGENKHAPVGPLDAGNLIPEKGEPHGFISLASSIFVFMNQHILSSDCLLMRSYARGTLSEQHMIILAGIIRDLDRETSRNGSVGSNFGSVVSKLYEEFSFSVAKYTHNLLATRALSEPLQNLLLSLLGVCPFQQEDWPLQVYPRTLAIVAQVFVLRQQREKDELKSESEAACVLIWKRFLQTLQKCILTPQTPEGAAAPVTSNLPSSSSVALAEDFGDLNVEHAQLLLFLFHSLQLMQKKTVLLDCAQAIMNMGHVIQTCMTENQLLIFSRLLLVFEYLMKNLYEAPTSLIEQIQGNLFNLQVTSAMVDSDKDINNKPSKFHFPCKDVEDNYVRHCDLGESQGGIKPRFYNLVNVEVGNMDVPKLDGFSSNFLLGTPDVLSYQKFYPALVATLGIGGQCDIPSRAAGKKLSHLGQCAVQYGFTISWRLLLSLPPSVAFLQSLTNPTPESQLSALPLSLIWIPRTAHKSFSAWLKDCLIKQGLTTQKAESLLRTLTNSCNTASYDVEQAKNVIKTLLAKYPNRDLDTVVPRQALPQLLQTCILDSVIAKLQVVVDENSKPSADIDPKMASPGVASDLLPEILQMISLYSTFIRSSLLYQMNDLTDPPGLYSQTAQVAHGLTLAISTSRCPKASAITAPISGYLPTALKTALERWNASSLSEFPAICAWRNAFANDPIPSESYVCAIQMCHIQTLSSQTSFNNNLALKHTLHALVRFVGNLIITCKDEKVSSSYVDVLFPLILDGSTENLADLITLSLERIIGSSENEEYLKKLYFHVLSIGHLLFKNHTDKDSGMDERIFHDLAKFIEGMFEKVPGRKALEKFYSKQNDFSDILLSSSNNHLSVSFGTTVLKLFIKLFELADKSPEDQSLVMLCSSLDKLAKVSVTILPKWLAKIIGGSSTTNEDCSILTNEDCSALQENRTLLQILASYIVQENSHVSEDVASALLHALTPMATHILIDSSDGVGFPELMVVMASLAGAGTASGHIPLLKSVSFWLCQCKKYLCEKDVTEKLQDGVLSGKLKTMMESVCCILSYLANTIGALKPSSEKYLASLRSGMTSPPPDGELLHLDIDSDWADDLGQDDEDSAGEDSDEDSLSNKLCTFTVTQKEFMNQHWYHCHTCKMVDGVGVCSICAKVCHKDHDVTYAKHGSFFCDCGAKEDGSCQALVKRVTATGSDANTLMGVGPSPFSSTSVPSSLRRRSSSPATNDRNSDAKKVVSQEEGIKRHHTLSKQLEPLRESILSSSLSLVKIATDILEMLQSLKPAIESNCYQNSPVGSNSRIQQALKKLHETDKTFETTDQLMVPTLGSQEGAFENVRMNYSGDQGQTIRQLIGAHMVRRVAMCVLASAKGKRQHLAVSHEKGKITILQLSSLLKQADTSKRKLTLTRLSSAPVPFTVLSITGNPCNEEFVAVCGLKDCHVLTFTSSGSIADHLALQPQAAVGNFIIKAVWLPGSQTELALVMPDFVKIYDLALDAISPQYYFLLPSGKIRDCCFAFTEDGQRHLLLMSSVGHIYTQIMCDESSAKHGPFYVTSVLEIKHPELKDTNGAFGSGGISLYYSHALQLLFSSYVNGKSFISPMSTMVPELQNTYAINFKTNGGGIKANNQPLCQWAEVPNHPGLVTCLTQTNNNPVVIMIKPDTILIQEIKLVTSKSKITDMVAIRHLSSSGDQRTTLILLCEDGSLRIYMANVDHTGFWLTPAHQSLAPPSVTRPSKKKKSTKVGRPPGSVSFPVDFFEHCVPLNEVEFGGNDVLQIYNTQQIKHRLNTTGMYIASTKPAGFTIEATNPDSSMVMMGVRIMVGGQDIQRAPAYIEIFNRSVQVTLTRSRWFDFPFTREESMQADKKISMFFGASSYPSGVTVVDTIKIYGKAKDAFGWPEDNDEFPTGSPTATVTTSSVQTGEGEGGVAAVPLPLTSLDRLLAGSLELLDNCFSVMPAGEGKQTLRPMALDLATQLLSLPMPRTVQHHSKGLLMALLTNKVAYHTHKDQALLSDVSTCLADMQSHDVGRQLDVESYYNLVSTARSIAVSRPQNLVRFADSLEETFVVPGDTAQNLKDDSAVTLYNNRLALLNAAERHTFLGQLVAAFWKLHDAQPCNTALAPVSQPGLPHLEAIVQALVDIIPAFASSDVDNVGLASKLYVQLLLCENPTVSFVCKQALSRALRPRYHRKVCIPSPSHGNAGISESRDNAKLSLPLATGAAAASQAQSDLESAHEVAAAMMSAGPLESLLTGQVSFSPMLDMPPDADDEAMVSLAIALSLQEEPHQPAGLGLQTFSLGNQHRTSSLERAQFSDTTASPGASDDEGSTAATDGSTLRTPPAEQGGSAGSESGGSGVDSITGEHNVSGRSSANGDNVPESTTTGARSETSSVGLPSTSMHPYADGCEVEAEAEMDGDATLRLHTLRLLLLEKFLQHVPKLREISGIRAIPFLQVILLLTSDLDGDNEKDRTALENLLNVMIGELEMGSTEAASMAERSPRHEVQLVIMRLLSVMISRTKSTGKSNTSTDSSAFISNATASALISHGAIPYCLQMLKSLLDYWKHYQADEYNVYALVSAGVGAGPPKGGLLKPHPVYPLPNMSPFFLRQYVKGHANDVFEAYPQLLTEMALRLPYQIKKMADGAASVASTSSATPSIVAPPVFDQTWFFFLCEYMMTQQTPFVRKQVRKLLLFICGSKERYRQLRDLYVLESNLKDAKVLCAQGGYNFQTSGSNVVRTVAQANSGVRNNAITLPYDTLITLIEHIKNCVEIATTRTINWQHFCEKDESVLPFLMKVSYLLDEGVSPIILQLLQCAISLTPASQSASSKTAQQPSGSNRQHKENEKSAQPKEEIAVDAEAGAPTSAEDARTPCATLVQQINKYVDSKVLSCFVKAFLLESNQSAVRWQAHSLVLSLFTHSTLVQQEALLDLMWRLWPQLPSYVRKAAQFVDLLGYFAIRIPPNERKAQEYVDRASSLLQEQNRILAYHPNAALYTAFQALVEFDGYYLESEPCLVCNDPEVPLANVKLSALKMDSCFTTTTQIVKLIGSHVISKIVLRVGDLKRSKMVRTICFYYNNRSVQAVVELKNKPAMWHKAKRCTMAAGQTELKVEFPLPIVACNLMIEYADFYENVQASSETLQCPRCSASVPANPGVCANCGENVFQCHKCRAINYDEKDPFLCNTCGFCKYSKFDYTLTAKPCCAVDPIENEEDRKKSVATINTLLEKADRVYRQLVGNKSELEVLLARINEHSFELHGDEGGIVVGAATAAAANNMAPAGAGVAGVNKAIQQLAQRYCGDCKSAFEDLGKIIQKVLATRRELVEYDRQQRDSGTSSMGPTTPVSRESLLRSLSGPAGTDEAQSLSSGRCYGCASAAIEHCITLLRALATDEHTRMVQCGQGLVRELVDYNLRQGSVQVCNEVRQLLCLLTRDNLKGTEELNSIIMEKISLAHRSQMNSSDFAASVHHEMALLAASVQRYDSCWEQRLRCVMNIFLLGVNSKSPVVMETITLPCLSILQSLIKPAPPVSKANKDKSIEALTSVKVEGTDVRIDLHKWLAGDLHHSFGRWKTRLPPNLPGTSSEGVAKKMHKKEESREYFLMEKYGTRWRNRTHRDVVPIKLVDSEWLRHVLFNPPSHAARQEACNMVESLCTIPTRKKEILDLLTSFLDDLGKSGESAAEFLALYQNLIKPAQWKSYLAIRGVLPHIGNLITKEISHLTWLEETTLKSDLCEGYALKMLTELLSSFIDQDNIRRHYKSRLVGTVLNGYLSLRKLVIQRTKMVDETQEKLLELLEEMTTGNEAETQAFMSVCVETVNKYPLDDYRTPVFIFERLCSIIYPEENDMGEYFVLLDKDPQQEDFLQGRMLGNPYSSNEPGVGPLMRDIKNKICQDCELVALLEDDNGMELLVNNKIISLDLPVKEVYKKVWLVENAEGEAMRIVYRMRGLLGDATEEFIESLDARSSEEVDNEEVYKMANWMSKCGGLAAMLQRLGSLNDVSRGRPLFIVLLKLFGFCTEVKSNRQALVQPEMKCMSTMLHVLRLALNADSEQLQGQPGGPTITEQLLQIMETILLEASSLSVAKYTEYTKTCGDEADIQFLLEKMSSPSIHNTPILQRLMRVLPFLTFASPPKLALLVNYFKPCSDFNRFDEEHTSNDDIKMECLCRMANSIERNALGDQLKTMIIDAGIVSNALKYIQQHAPPIRSALLLDSDELKDFITKPSLKYILRLLTGLSQGHEATQLLVGTDCVPIIHRLEQVSSDEHVGSLAENLMEALRENPNVVEKIEEARRLTRAEKKRLAMAMREKQLAGLGMSTNEKGQVTAKSPILQQMEDLGEESGLVCVICREGYRFQPAKVLGIYTYTKRCNADDFENKPRKTAAYTTVTHFNVTHVDCHVAAVRLARGRDEWESAALQNANTRCNGLLPLWGPQVPESAFASCLARHNTYLQECTGHRDIGYASTTHDLKMLIMRFANEKSFSEDSGGGGPQSNLHLVPYLIHMALYVINTTRSAAKEDKSATTFLELPIDKWVENSFEADGPLYATALTLSVRSYSKWQETRVEYLKRLLVLAHARHVSPQGATRITDKEVKEYNVYKPILIFFGMVNGLFSYLFKKVTVTSEVDWSSSLAEYIRNNDQLMLEGCDKLLSQYQDELLPCQSFEEFCDVVGLLVDIPNPDEFFTGLLSKLP